MEVLDFIEEEDPAALDSKEKVFDEHMNRLSDNIERLQELEELVATIEPVRPHASSDHQEDTSGSMRDENQLKYFKTILDKAKATISLLEPTPAMDICLV